MTKRFAIGSVFIFFAGSILQIEPTQLTRGSGYNPEPARKLEFQIG